MHKAESASAEQQLEDLEGRRPVECEHALDFLIFVVHRLKTFRRCARLVALEDAKKDIGGLDDVLDDLEVLRCGDTILIETGRRGIYMIQSAKV